MIATDDISMTDASASRRRIRLDERIASSLNNYQGDRSKEDSNEKKMGCVCRTFPDSQVNRSDKKIGQL
jgi:hypothetical protein